MVILIDRKYIENHSSIYVDRYGNRTARTAEPYQLVLKGSHWYWQSLSAFIHGCEHPQVLIFAKGAERRWLFRRA